jgi:hypothetical protein
MNSSFCPANPCGFASNISATITGILAVAFFSLPTVAQERHLLRVKIEGARGNAARVSIVDAAGEYHAPTGAVLRKTARDIRYFYADVEFSVSIPKSVRMTFTAGLESVPQSISILATADTEMSVKLADWIDMTARSWYSGDSHVHLNTGGPISASTSDAILAARAEGLNYVNLCISNNLGDDIRDQELITGVPHPHSTERHLLVFGEEMRSSIYGHMQFFGIKKFVEPQYTGFDNTPNSLDFPANLNMAKETCDQGGIVTYGHPMLKNSPDAFAGDLAAGNGAARELPIDLVHGVVHAMDIMSYNSDEALSSQLWYQLLNCGFKISACVGTDALLDNSTEPMGGSRVYVKTKDTFNQINWLEGLRHGRTIVTNGPIPLLTVNGQEIGSTCNLASPGNVRVSATVDSLVPVKTVDIVINGEVVKTLDVAPELSADAQHVQWELDIPISKSSWIALRVHGLDDPRVFDGPTWAHTSPVYVMVAGKPISNKSDAKYFVGWIDQMLRVVAIRNRYPSAKDRETVEMVFRKARDYYVNMAQRPD